MKPTFITTRSEKRFPLIECNYHSVTLSGYRGHCAKPTAPSFLDISRPTLKRSAARFLRRSGFVLNFGPGCDRADGERSVRYHSTLSRFWSALIQAVTPQRQPKENTIVRPAGFTPNLSSMDVPREGVAAKKRKRRIIIIAASALGLILATIAISRLKPAVPSVDRSTVWIDTVKRGPMVRQVRGLGTLVPEEIRWIPANTEGRVEKIIVWPGTHVEPDTVILELSSPDFEQSAHDAELKATAAEAELTSLRATLQREVLDQESTTAQFIRSMNKLKWSGRPTTNWLRMG